MIIGRDSSRQTLNAADVSPLLIRIITSDLSRYSFHLNNGEVYAHLIVFVRTAPKKHHVPLNVLLFKMNKKLM